MMRKILIGIVALVAVVIIGAIVAVSVIDVNAYKGQIQAEAEKATGRKLELKGDMKLSILTLTPSLSVSDVTFANAPWGSRPEMITFKTFSAEVQLMPLLSKQVKVNRLVLKGADILLETKKDGAGNWVFEPKGAAAPTPAPTQPAPGKSAPPADIEVKRVVIEDLALTYKDGQTGQATTLGLDKLDLKADSPSAPLLIALEGKFNNKPMSINGKLATVETLKAAGEKPLPLALDIKFGNSHLIGDMTVQAKGTPRVKGTLNVPVLDVKELQEASGSQPSGTPSTTTGQPAKPTAKSDKVFSDEPLNLAVLKAAEADLDLKGDKIILEGATLEKLAGKIMLHNGKLDIDKFTVDVKGSTLAGDVMLDGSGATPKLDVAFAGRKIDVGALMQRPGQEKLIEGLADVDIDLTGAGASMHQIAGSLNGKTSVVMGEGRLNNKYLRIVAGDLFKIIDPWASKEDTGKLNCVVSKFDIKQGVATSQAMVVDGAAFSVLGDGTINLGPETLALVVDAKPKNSSLLNLAVPVRVGGTLANPSFTPDPAAVAKGIIGAAGSVLGSGAIGGGALGGVLGNVLGGQAQQQKPAAASGEADPCVKAVSGKAAAPAQQPAQPTGQAAPAPKSGAAGAVEGVKKGLKGILP
jgi:AsmA family protein